MTPMNNNDWLLKILNEIATGRKIKASSVPASKRQILNNLVDKNRLKLKDGYYCSKKAPHCEVLLVYK